MSSFESAVLAEHNRLRAKHSAAPLTLNATISKCAQEWANYLASRNVVQHRSKRLYGENIYASLGKTNITGAEVVQAWYKEIKDYTFGQAHPNNFSKVGHFTQVVWKSTKQLGVGIAKNGNNVYVVCNYDPPGNYAQEYLVNVGKRVNNAASSSVSKSGSSSGSSSVSKSGSTSASSSVSSSVSKSGSTSVSSSVSKSGSTSGSSSVSKSGSTSGSSSVSKSGSTSGSSSGSKSGVGTSPLSFEAAVLATHNRLRAKHSAGPLTLNPAISKYAQEWANHIASRDTMQHRPTFRYGENLYVCMGRTNVPGEEVVEKAWYKEIKDYTFGQGVPSNIMKVGHFTQVVWKNTKQLGVGMAKNGNTLYVVCNYHPAGNIAGLFPANVTRSLAGCSDFIDVIILLPLLEQYYLLNILSFKNEYAK